MGAGHGWIFWAEQGKLAPDGVVREVELYDFAGVPESDESAVAVFCGGDGNGVGAGYGVAFGEIEAMEDGSGGCVDKESVVGEIVSDK